MKEKKQIEDYVIDEELDLDRIVDDFSPYVKAIISNIGKDNLTFEDKEEILSDTFFVLWKSKYEDIISLSSYIAGITRNLIREKYRKKKITYNIEDYENILIFSDNKIELFSEERESIEKVNNILKKFKPMDIKIINMFYYSSKSTKDIAKELNISEINTRAKLSRIRKRIKKELGIGGKYGRQ